jgi:AraC family transcriptional regulator
MRDRELFRSPLFTIAEFVLPPDHPRWRMRNVIDSPGPLVAFPAMAVGVSRAGAAPLLATPNLVMLYNPGDEYTRRVVDPRGDRCIYIVLHEVERLTASHAPVDRLAYLHHHLLARQLEAGAVDSLLVEETALRLVRSVLGHERASLGRRSRTRTLHHALAEAAKELLAVTVAEQLSLHEIGARLGASPFHLARVFREQTGYSLHEYRTNLRLRLDLARLAESRGSLTTLAFELGFTSHSHFTDTFRRQFGVAPSAVRDGTLELSTNSEVI